MSEEFRGVEEISWSPISHACTLFLTGAKKEELALITHIHWDVPIANVSDWTSTKILVRFAYPIVVVKAVNDLFIKPY